MSLLLRNLPERDVPSAGAVDELLAEDAVPPADGVAQRQAPVDECAQRQAPVDAGGQRQPEEADPPTVAAGYSPA